MQDTMSFTASALSFLLEDLGKTLILTGAQIPLGELRNDAVENLLGSLVLAGGYVIPGELTAMIMVLTIQRSACSSTASSCVAIGLQSLQVPSLKLSPLQTWIRSPKVSPDRKRSLTFSWNQH